MLVIGRTSTGDPRIKESVSGRHRTAHGKAACYTSRVENGHTVPSIDTLQKYAQALEIPLYQLFYDDEEAPKKIKEVNLDG